MNPLDLLLIVEPDLCNPQKGLFRKVSPTLLVNVYDMVFTPLRAGLATHVIIDAGLVSVRVPLKAPVPLSGDDRLRFNAGNLHLTVHTEVDEQVEY